MENAKGLLYTDGIITRYLDLEREIIHSLGGGRGIVHSVLPVGDEVYIGHGKRVETLGCPSARIIKPGSFESEERSGIVASVINYNGRILDSGSYGLFDTKRNAPLITIEELEKAKLAGLDSLIVDDKGQLLAVAAQDNWNWTRYFLVEISEDYTLGKRILDFGMRKEVGSRSAFKDRSIHANAAKIDGVTLTGNDGKEYALGLVACIDGWKLNVHHDITTTTGVGDSVRTETKRIDKNIKVKDEWLESARFGSLSLRLGGLNCVEVLGINDGQLDIAYSGCNNGRISVVFPTKDRKPVDIVRATLDLHTGELSETERFPLENYSNAKDLKKVSDENLHQKLIQYRVRVIR